MEIISTTRGGEKLLLDEIMSLIGAVNDKENVMDA